MVTLRERGGNKEWYNPTATENWPQKPKTEKEFEAWMQATKEALLEWLKIAQGSARSASDKKQIKDLKKEEIRQWSTFKSQTDIQTGRIYSTAEQDKLVKWSAAAKERRKELHISLGTKGKNIDHNFAQWAWEDFLYYQNIWNRKNDLSKMYPETHSEKQQGARKKKPGALCSDVNNLVEEIYQDAFWAWRKEIMKVFRDFCVGSRKRDFEDVGPQDAHRYTQPPKGTTPQVLPRFRKRQRHLEERFPSKRPRVVDPDDHEEDNRTQVQRQKDNELERKGRMIPIHWDLDNKRFEVERRRKENNGFLKAKNGLITAYAMDVRTQKLLPERHNLHHGCTEKSSDWPTSFESAAWGNEISRTAIKRTRAYEEVTDEEADEDYVPGEKRKPRRHKRDEAGAKIVKMTRGRFRVRTLKKPGKRFIHDRDDDGMVVGRDREGKWAGHEIDSEIEEQEFELDEEGLRVPETPRIGHRNIFTTTMVQKSDAGGRRERHMDEGVTEQLSDDESEGETNANPNYHLSGNANPDQVGNPTVWDEDNDPDDGENSSAGGEGNTGGGGGSGDEGEVDDDGDLFRQSYEEISRPTNDRLFAREQRVLDDLRAENAAPKNLEAWELNYPVSLGWSYERIRN